MTEETEVKHVVTEKEKFRIELENLLNRYCWDNATNIPDFILAEHVIACLVNISLTTAHAMRWHNWPSLSEKLGLDVALDEKPTKSVTFQVEKDPGEEKEF